MLKEDLQIRRIRQIVSRGRLDSRDVAIGGYVTITVCKSGSNLADGNRKVLSRISEEASKLTGQVGYFLESSTT